MTRSCAWPGGPGVHSGVTKFPSLTHHLPLPIALPPPAAGVWSSSNPFYRYFHTRLNISDDKFSHNMSFRRADWVNERIPEDEAGYDVIMG